MERKRWTDEEVCELFRVTPEALEYMTFMGLPLRQAAEQYEAEARELAASVFVYRPESPLEEAQDRRRRTIGTVSFRAKPRKKKLKHTCGRSREEG